MLKGSREEGKHGLKIKKQLGALFSSNTADISPKRPTSAQRKTAVDMSGSDFAVEPDFDAPVPQQWSPISAGSEGLRSCGVDTQDGHRWELRQGGQRGDTYPA